MTLIIGGSLLTRTAVTFAVVAREKVRYLLPVTDVFQLKICYADVQSCQKPASCCHSDLRFDMTCMLSHQGYPERRDPFPRFEVKAVSVGKRQYRGADKALDRPGTKQATATKL
jgi:hypothetical protein